MEPYLSVVIAVREKTEDELRRVQLFVDAWADQARRHGLPCEVVIAGTTASSIEAPRDPGCCEVRCVATPVGAGAAKAQNAGIRQARGRFILSTGPGILFSDEVVVLLASRQLDAACIYRANRYDVESLPAGIAESERLAFWRAHSIRLHAREGTFDLTPDGLRRNSADDIAAIDSGIHFGSGWFPPEKHAPTGETCRWMRDEAEIIMHPSRGGGILLIEMEPGPGIGTLPQFLDVIDASDRVVSRWEIAARVKVALAIPDPQGANVRFRLRISGGGGPIFGDDRILDLAVFHCTWAPPNLPLKEQRPLIPALQKYRSILGRMMGSDRKNGFLQAIAQSFPFVLRAARLLSRRGNDIFEAGMDFQVGPGWYYLEEAGGERFRWLSREARLFLRMPPAGSRIAMLIETGPTEDRTPRQFIARLEDENGAILAQHTLIGLTYLEFAVPAAPGSIAALYFKSEGATAPTRHDIRPLSFRVFACGAGAREVSRTPTTNHWPLLPLESKTASRDWVASLEPQRRELDEMGRPDHLHTNMASDFLLMSRERWLDVRGFPEIGMTPGHRDALLLYAAHLSGAREVVLADSMRIYLAGASPATQGPNDMPPAVQHEDLMWLIAQMRSLHAPAIFNGEDWGC